jgi:osmotically-inducible protein OsmY
LPPRRVLQPEAMTEASTRMTELRLKDAIVDELSRAAGVNTAHIGVSVSGGAVLLTGEVDSYPEKLAAATCAQRVPGVTAVAQEISVRRAGAQPSDIDLARLAGERMQGSVNVPDTISVSVHDHTITLAGEATTTSRRAAINAATCLPGVGDIRDRITVLNGAALIVAGVQEAIAVTCDPRGRVTLGGLVRSLDEEGQAVNAACAARGVTGVTDHLTVRN